jgi:hypothetical protein
MSEMETESAPGSSQEQQEAEDLVIGLLGKSLGLALVKKRFELPAGGWLEIDGYCDSPRTLCEAWAHIGKPKSAQKNKVMADAMKLLFASSLAPGHQSLILYQITPSLHIVPSVVDRYWLELDVFDREKVKRFIRALLGKIEHSKSFNYDCVFFDCPPNFTALSYSVLGCSSVILIPGSVRQALRRFRCWQAGAN